jgi:hypothetical protein
MTVLLNQNSSSPLKSQQIMKRTIYLLALACSFIVLSCNDKGQPDRDHDKDHGKDNGKGGLTVVPPNTMPISIDSANKMLQSYLNSTACPGDTNITAVIFDADSLRKYLNDTSSGGTAGSRIKYVKFMFAHTLNYINNGGQDQNCGYNHEDLTLIVAGYDVSSNYVYTAQGMVIDKGMPCPANCPTGGSAASNILPHVPSQGNPNNDKK